MDMLIRVQNKSKLNSLVEDCIKYLGNSEEIGNIVRPRAVLMVDSFGRDAIVTENV